MTWKTARLEPECQLRSTFIFRLLFLMHFHPSHILAETWKLKNFVISSYNYLILPCSLPKKPNTKVRTLDSEGKLHKMEESCLHVYLCKSLSYSSQTECHDSFLFNSSFIQGLIPQAGVMSLNSLRSWQMQLTPSEGAMHVWNSTDGSGKKTGACTAVTCVRRKLLS